MGLQLVTLRSWLIERVRIMPAPLLVLVFMILINIHQSGIKNQVSEGFHDLKIILNIECNAQMFAAESWVSSRPLCCSCAHVQVQPVPRHLTFYISYFWLDQNLCRIYHCSTDAAGCRMFRSARIVSAVHLKGVQHPALLIRKSKITTTILYSLSLLTSSQDWRKCLFSFSRQV